MQQVRADPGALADLNLAFSVRRCGCCFLVALWLSSSEVPVHMVCDVMIRLIPTAAIVAL
jgi:hypothetical protein